MLNILCNFSMIANRCSVVLVGKSSSWAYYILSRRCSGSLLSFWTSWCIDTIFIKHWCFTLCFFCKAIHVMKTERSLTFWKPLEMGRVGYTYPLPWCELIKRIQWKYSVLVDRCAAIMAWPIETHYSFVTIPWGGSQCRGCAFLLQRTLHMNWREGDTLFWKSTLI